MCSRDSSCLASGALPTPHPLLRKRAELLYLPILDEEQLLKSPVPSKIISQSQKRKKQEQKVQHLWWGFEWGRKNSLQTPVCPVSLTWESTSRTPWTRWIFPAFVWSYLSSRCGSGGNDGLRSRGWRYCRAPSISARCPPWAWAGFGLCRGPWMQSAMLWPDRLGSAFACFQYDANNIMRYAEGCPKWHQHAQIDVNYLCTVTKKQPLQVSQNKGHNRHEKSPLPW